jgi:hypothetical protein
VVLGVVAVVVGTGVPGAVVAVGTGALVDVGGTAVVVVGGVVPLVGTGVVAGVGGTGVTGVTGAVVAGATGAAVVVLAVAAVVADVAGVVVLSCVSRSASRMPTMSASRPAATIAASGPRRRCRGVPQAGQKSASVATGVPHTGHGRTATAECELIGWPAGRTLASRGTLPATAAACPGVTRRAATRLPSTG